MSNDKALAIIPRTVAEVQTLSELISKSVLLPDALRGKSADVIVSILAGAELGLAPLASIRGVHVIKGKPVLAADTMMGIVLGSGLAEYFSQVETSATSVTFETKRKGSPHAQRCTWTMEDAKRAGVDSNNTWRLYPRQMLAARAKAELARSAYPDVLAGCYDPDEVAIEAIERPVRNDNETADAEIIAPELAAIAQAETIEQLNGLAKSLAALPAGSKEIARTAWKARQADLTGPT